MPVKLKLANSKEVGAPKPSKASKKNKKSWRKNVDMSDVNEYLEEKRFEERVGGSVTDKPDEALFTLDTNVDTELSETKRKRREDKPLKCFALLNGLPGAANPVPVRNHTLTPEQRENPIVKDKRLRNIKEGKIQKKHLDRVKDRKTHLEKKEATKAEAKTRRRTTFDFDLWDDEGSKKDGTKNEKLPDKDWVNKEALVQTAIGTSQYVPRSAKDRTVTSGSKLEAVEVPESGASYNPSLQDHQELLWKAAMVEIDKEKENQRIERLTTGMFPSKDHAPSAESKMKELSEGIVELGDDAEEDENEEEIEKIVIGNKPKTRRQLRDRRKKIFSDQKKEREKDVKIREIEVSRVKSIKKELKANEVKTEERKEKKKAAAEEKLHGPIRLSNYKYEPQEIEIKLSDELTGNLRNLKQEGSLLEDRFKSLQRRNMIEVRVKQKTVRKLKRKTFEKRSHKMGWEENQNKVNKRIRMESRLKRRKV